jgi:hypothetical protein
MISFKHYLSGVLFSLLFGTGETRTTVESVDIDADEKLTADLPRHLVVR